MYAFVTLASMLRLRATIYEKKGSKGSSKRKKKCSQARGSAFICLKLYSSWRRTPLREGLDFKPKFVDLLSIILEAYGIFNNTTKTREHFIKMNKYTKGEL